MEQVTPGLVRTAERSVEAPPRHPLSERIAPLMKSINQRSRSIYVFADKQLHAHPWGSAGAAFGLGIVFGALIGLVSRRH
jgi:ElaB/YqjD/DUF883 family membrane-anchored ribosome-binding protein